MEKLLLTARVRRDHSRYTARVDGLPLEAGGPTAASAQDELVQAMRAWIEAQDAAERLEETLAAAGFPGVTEDTELELEFLETETGDTGQTEPAGQAASQPQAGPGGNG